VSFILKNKENLTFNNLSGKKMNYDELKKIVNTDSDISKKSICVIF
jgi:hypothetical protein